MKKEIFLISFLFIIIISIFFYPVFKGYIPFPGDLLVGGYAPYNTYPFLGYSPGGYPNKGQSFDVLRMIFPAKFFSIEILKGGNLPFWDPFLFSGNPHLASLQSGTFYVFNLLFFILPNTSAWTIYIILQPLLAAIFTYYLLRELSLQKTSSIIGAVAFAFSSYMTVWMEYGNLVHTIFWLPLAMLLVIRIIRKPDILKSILLVSVLCFSILAGYIQTTFYVFLFLTAFILFIVLTDYKRQKQFFLLFVLLLILPFLITASQLLPTFELILNSTRSAYTTQELYKLLIPQLHTITMLIPDFFGNPATRTYWLEGTYIERVSYFGIIPLFFLVYGLIRKPNRIQLFFIFSLIVIYLLSFDSFLSRLFYSLHIPFLFTSVPTRIMFLFCFSGSILAAFGYDDFERNRNLKKTLIIIAFFGIVFISLFSFTLITPAVFQNGNLYGVLARRSMIIPVGVLSIGILAIIITQYFKRIRKHLFVFILLLIIFDLFYFFQKITPFAPSASVYPQTSVFSYLRSIQGIDRSWGYGGGHIDTNIQSYEKIYTTDGYNPLHIKEYGELLSTSEDGNMIDDLPVSMAEIQPGFGAEELRMNNYRQRILDILGVKYILNRNDLLKNNMESDYLTFPEKTYKLIWQDKPWQIYENKQALPRVFITGNYKIETNKQTRIKAIINDDTILQKQLVLEEKPKGIDPSLTTGKVDVLSYSPNSSSFKIFSQQPALLFLSDNFYPGWYATVDNINVKIYRANHSFRAVVVPEGIHTVIFSYIPETFIYGLWISGLTIVGCIVVFLYIKFKQYA